MNGGHALAQRGFEAAWSRYDEVRLERDAQVACVAAIEVVVWAVAVEDLLRRAYDRKHGKDSWWPHRSHLDPDGRLAAARWVRNRGVHDVAQLLDVQSGRSYPRVYPLAHHELVWLDPESIEGWRPEADQGHGLNEYRQHVGRPARVLLTGLDELLAGPLAAPPS